MSPFEFVRLHYVAERRAEAAQKYRDGGYRTLADAYASVDVTLSQEQYRTTLLYAWERLTFGRGVVSRYGVAWSQDPVGRAAIARIKRSVAFLEQLLVLLEAKGAA